MAQSPKTNQGGASLSSKVWLPSMKTVQSQKWLASRKIWSAEKLETLPAGTKPRTSHIRSPGGERRGKRKRETIFLERTTDDHRQWDEHWNCFKGNVGGISERRGGAHNCMGFYERMDTILNWTELIWPRHRNNTSWMYRPAHNKTINHNTQHHHHHHRVPFFLYIYFILFSK